MANDDIPKRWQARTAGPRVEIRSDEMLVVEDEHLIGEDLSGCRLPSGFVSLHSQFERCRFDGLASDACFGAGRRYSEYHDCSFDRSEITAHVVGRARFVRCSFKDVALRDWISHEAEFESCVFSGRATRLIFHGSRRRFGGLRRRRNRFSGNDFAEMNLTDVSFRSGIDLSQQRLPDDPDYLCLPDAKQTLACARREIGTGDSEESRILSVYEDFIREGQEQLLVRRSELEGEGAPGLVRLLERCAGLDG